MSTRRHPYSKDFDKDPTLKTAGEEGALSDTTASPSSKKGKGKKSKMPKLKKEEVKSENTTHTGSTEMPKLEADGKMLVGTELPPTLPPEPSRQILDCYLPGPQVPKSAEESSESSSKTFENAYYEHCMKHYQRPIEEVVKLRRSAGKQSLKCIPGLSGAPSSSTDAGNSSWGGLVPGEHLRNAQIFTLTQPGGTAQPGPSSAGSSDQQQSQDSGSSQQQGKDVPSDGAADMPPDVREEPGVEGLREGEVKMVPGVADSTAEPLAPILEPEMPQLVKEGDDVKEGPTSTNDANLGEPPAKLPKMEPSGSGDVATEIPPVPEPLPDIVMEGDGPVTATDCALTSSAADVPMTLAVSSCVDNVQMGSSSVSSVPAHLANGLLGVSAAAGPMLTAGNNTARSAPVASKGTSSKGAGIKRMATVSTNPQLQLAGGQTQFVLQGVTQLHPVIEPTTAMKQAKQATLLQQKVGTGVKGPIYQQVLVSPKGQKAGMKPLAIVKSPVTTQAGVLNVGAGGLPVTVKAGAPATKGTSKNGVQIQVPTTSRKRTVREELAKIINEKLTTFSQEGATISQTVPQEHAVLTTMATSAQTMVVPSTSQGVGVAVPTPKVVGQPDVSSHGQQLSTVSKPVLVSQASIAPTTSILQNVAVGQKMVSTHVQGNRQVASPHVAKAVSPKGISSRPQATILVSGSNQYKLVDAASLMSTSPTLQLAGLQQGQLKSSGTAQPKIVLQSPIVTGLGAGQARSLLVTPPTTQTTAILSQPKAAAGQTAKKQTTPTAAPLAVSIAGLNPGPGQQLQLINNQLVLTTTSPQVQQQLVRQPVKQVIIPKADLKSEPGPSQAGQTLLPAGAAVQLIPSSLQQPKNLHGVTASLVQAQPLSTTLSLHTTTPGATAAKTESPAQTVTKTESSLLHPSPTASPASLMVSQLQSDPQVVSTLTTVKQDPFLGPTETVPTLGENCALTTETSSETASETEHIAEAVVTETVSTAVDMGGEYTVPAESPLYIAEQPDIAVDHSYQQSFSDSELAKELLKKPKKKAGGMAATAADASDTAAKKKVCSAFPILKCTRCWPRNSGYASVWQCFYLFGCVDNRLPRKKKAARKRKVRKKAKAAIRTKNEAKTLGDIRPGTEKLAKLAGGLSALDQASFSMMEFAFQHWWFLLVEERIRSGISGRIHSSVSQDAVMVISRVGNSADGWCKPGSLGPRGKETLLYLASGPGCWEGVQQTPGTGWTILCSVPPVPAIQGE